MDNDRRIEMTPRARNRIVWRPALVAALAAHVALTFCIGTAFAQESGGEAVAQELVDTPGALQQIRERAVARLGSFQALQSLRAGQGFASGPITGVISAAPQNAFPSGSALNGENPAAERSALNRQAVARIPGRPDGGFLAGFSGGRPLSPHPVPVAEPALEPATTTFIDNSNNLFVDANGSPVVIGNNNVIRQQVSTSIATSTSGPAVANSAAESGRRRGSGGATESSSAVGNPGTGSGHRHGKAAQAASSSAVTRNGTATATSSNNDASPRVPPRSTQANPAR
jgi:hypothetical protein